MEFVSNNLETEGILVDITTIGTIFINFARLRGSLLDLRYVVYSKSFHPFILAPS
jgi:hypothetical protein